MRTLFLAVAVLSALIVLSLHAVAEDSLGPNGLIINATGTTLSEIDVDPAQRLQPDADGYVPFNDGIDEQGREGDPDYQMSNARYDNLAARFGKDNSACAAAATVETNMGFQINVRPPCDASRDGSYHEAPQRIPRLNNPYAR